MRKSWIVTILSMVALNSASGQGFTDAANLWGLQFPYGAGEYGGGASFADFNLDGLDDLTVSTNNGLPIRFFQNNGEGFVEITSPVTNNTDTRAIIWVDYDNDGDLDLYSTSHHGNKLFKNTGSFVFEDITLTCGFNEPTTWKSYSASWTDYNKDGLPDLCVAFRINHLVGQIALYKNLGNDQFVNVASESGFGGLGNSVLATAAFDMNNDGWEDIFIGQDFQAGCLMMKNNGDGTFQNISVQAGANILNNTMTVTIGDYDGDGFFDVFLTDTQITVHLKNNGNETFTNTGSSFGLGVLGFTFGAQALDADNDGDVDVHINSNITSRMLENTGPQSPFVESTNAWGFATASNFGVGVCVGDFNTDGYPDLFKCNKNAPGHSLWQNNFSSNNYLSVDLVGTVSNSFAIGTVLKAWTNGVCQMRRVGCGEGFSSQNSYTQFFGFGQENTVDSLIIDWPSGIVNTIYNIETNQRIQVIEQLVVYGCMDPSACNYNPEASSDNGLCMYPELFFDCQGQCLNDMDADGVCDELEIAGCTDTSACNYSAEATDEDGTCQYLTQATITGNAVVQVSENETYVTSIADGVYYFWNVSPGNSILAGQGLASAEVLWNQPGNQWVSVIPSIEGVCTGDSTVFFVNVITTSIDEISPISLEVYPNPTNGHIYIRLPFGLNLPVEINVTDLSGRKLVSYNAEKHIMHYDLNSLCPGTYLVTTGVTPSVRPFRIVLTE